MSGTTNMFTIPLDIYLRVCESDFCSRMKVENDGDYIAIMLGKREPEHDRHNKNSVLFDIFVLEPEQQTSEKNTYFAANVCDEKKQKVIEAKECLKYNQVQWGSFR